MKNFFHIIAGGFNLIERLVATEPNDCARSFKQFPKMKNNLMLLLLFSLPLEVKAGPDEWQKLSSDCMIFQRFPNFRTGMKEFRNFVAEGRIWKANTNLQNFRVKKIIGDTCAKWASNPNGDSALREFIEKYAEVSNGAIKLSERADTYLEPTVLKWLKSESLEVGKYRLRFEDFKCGRSFLTAQKRIKEELKLMKVELDALREKCPVADVDAANNEKIRGNRLGHQNFGQGGPTSINKPRREPAASNSSTITGNTKSDLHE